METLNQHMKEHTFKRVYLLYGEEQFLVNNYKKTRCQINCCTDTTAQRKHFIVEYGPSTITSRCPARFLKFF